MTFYSGFSLSHDKRLFDPYLKASEYTIAGFSYGAISAFEEALKSEKRIDTLQLFSPAFFQDKNEKFKRMQLIYFLKEKQAYLKNFLSSCFSPAPIDESVVMEQGSEEQLRELLYYEWKTDKLKALKDRGVEIEVYLGSEDRIIDPKKSKAFFLPFATTYMINRAGHTLQTKEKQ
ncbi:MAG: pimelyl-ACP methyl ester esterase BioV [Campylobacterales bacterium]|nr:pimelyl-ACP methyl ester esterase BioV [Campylobacterales bacterium]